MLLFCVNGDDCFTRGLLYPIFSQRGNILLTRDDDGDERLIHVDDKRFKFVRIMY